MRREELNATHLQFSLDTTTLGNSNLTPAYARPSSAVEFHAPLSVRACRCPHWDPNRCPGCGVAGREPAAVWTGTLKHESVVQGRSALCAAQFGPTTRRKAGSNDWKTGRLTPPIHDMNSVKRILTRPVGGIGDVQSVHQEWPAGPLQPSVSALSADLPWQEKRRVQQDLKGAVCRRVRSAASLPPTWTAPTTVDSTQTRALPPVLHIVRAPQVGWLDVDEAAALPMPHVSAGQMLATVRALGVDFRVDAPCSGTLTEWHATSGMAVGYGQLLATLKPD
jgi:biotin carboxyl carrier protein